MIDISDSYYRRSSCIFGIKRENEELNALSPKNQKYEWPVNDLWAVENRRLNEDAGLVETSINLANASPSITFIASYSIDESNVPSLPIFKSNARMKYSSDRSVDFSSGNIQIFKQGDDYINKVVDIHANVFRCRDGLFNELCFNVCYKRTNELNIDKFSIELDDEFINRCSTFMVSFNSSKLTAELSIDGRLKKTFPLGVFHSMNLPLSTPFDKSKENMTLKIGDKKRSILRIENALVISSYLNLIS